MKKRVALLGATGSIGKNALDVIRRGKDDFEVVLLSSHTDREGLERLAGDFPGAALALSGSGAPAGGVSYSGGPGLLRAIAECGADITVNGIAGAAGLEPSLAALGAGSDLALANKETLVLAGPLVFNLAREKKARVLPVDSEHSAIFYLLRAHGAERAEEILLTASGGPFRNYSLKQLALVGPGEALAHPTWSMGPKITVDSATLANKGLEVIEAARLFALDCKKITVVVHPQSVVHSMVRLKDGAVYAQLSRPDMRLPLHEALYFPDCTPSPFGALSFESLTLEFEKPDFEKFPMLPLAYEAAREGALYPAAYNAANEIAVTAFLEEKAAFLDIPRVVDYVLKKDWKTNSLSLESILDADRRARDMAAAYIEGLAKEP